MSVVFEVSDASEIGQEIIEDLIEHEFGECSYTKMGHVPPPSRIERGVHSSEDFKSRIIYFRCKHCGEKISRSDYSLLKDLEDSKDSIKKFGITASALGEILQ